MQIPIINATPKDKTWEVSCTCGYMDAGAGLAVPALVIDHYGLHVDRGELSHNCGYILNTEGKETGFYCSCGHTAIGIFERYPYARKRNIDGAIRQHMKTHPSRAAKASGRAA